MGLQESCLLDGSVQRNEQAADVRRPGGNALRLFGEEEPSLEVPVVEQQLVLGESWNQ